MIHHGGTLTPQEKSFHKIWLCLFCGKWNSIPFEEYSYSFLYTGKYISLHIKGKQEDMINFEIFNKEISLGYLSRCRCNLSK